MIDSHSHSIFSHDGKVTLKSLFTRAKELKMTYYAVTEHLDLDYKYGGMLELCIRQLSTKQYSIYFEKNKKKFEGDSIYLAMGVECGYHPKQSKLYKQKIASMPLDVVINSVHSIEGKEAYGGRLFKGREEAQDEIYNKYLDIVYDSLLVDYPYQIVGHLGYITRYAPYKNPILFRAPYLDKIDKVLLKIIELDKTIELNTHIKDKIFLPETALMDRYFELGGNNVTFSSDAHITKDIGLKYEQVMDYLKSKGCTYLTIYKKMQPFKVAID